MQEDIEKLSVEIVGSQTRYGRLLGGATGDYILRVYLRITNETPEPALVKSIAIAFDGRVLTTLLLAGPSLPILLTSKGQEVLRTNKVYSAPFTIPPASMSERYAFFQLPANFHDTHPLHCTAMVTFSSHQHKDIPFIAEW